MRAKLSRRALRWAKDRIDRVVVAIPRARRGRAHIVRVMLLLTFAAAEVKCRSALRYVAGASPDAGAGG